MVISAECLVAQANACLSKALTMCEVAQLVGVNTNLNTVPYSVACVAALPDATCNTGRFVYVSDICDYRLSDGAAWIRDFVSDVPVSNLLTWGSDDSGQLGDGGANTLQMSPVVPSGGYTQSWCNISAGFLHTSAVKIDGTVWTWGLNNCGQLGNCSVVNRSSPGTVCGGGTIWCQIHAGRCHTVAIKTDGTAWTWGDNTCGQLGDSTVTNRSSPGALDGGGTTWCQIHTGDFHTAAIKTDCTAWTWGGNSNGQLGDNTSTNRSSPGAVAGINSDWCAVSTGASHTVAIKTDATAWTWGSNNFCQLGDGTSTNRSSPGVVAGINSDWCAIDAGSVHTVAVKTDSTAWAWGNNVFGQLGDGTATNKSSPVATTGTNSLWCEISAGTWHTSAVKTDGTAWTWGANCCGEQGTSPLCGRSSPGLVSGGINTWCSTSAGGLHTVGLIT
jgi:alpha-tubulin suppressor-like RCC1 family protein